MLHTTETLYSAIKPLLFRLTPMQAHALILRLLALADHSTAVCWLLAWIYRWAFLKRRSVVGTRNGASEFIGERTPHWASLQTANWVWGLTIGGVRLDHPLILAAGFVKGHGFASEADALAAVERGENIIPGWRSMPALVGLVEFGSFTRYPRMGNSGVVMWRDPSTQSTQNRVGLKNPGAQAAAAFLARNRRHLPRTYGINIAVSPGVSDLDQGEREIREAIRFFLSFGVVPSWFTLNLSCPNTEDDPGANQTEAQARRFCAAAADVIGHAAPLWIKLSPDLAPEQLDALLKVAVETGVRSIIATNTLAQPTHDDPQINAGVGGGHLYASALQTVSGLLRTKERERYNIDVIACGGIVNGQTFAAFGTPAGQYWSALIYRGALAAAVIEREYEQLGCVDTSGNRRSRLQSEKADDV